MASSSAFRSSSDCHGTPSPIAGRDAREEKIWERHGDQAAAAAANSP
jgi:hypothetical protein